MFASKSSLVATFLIVISIIYAFATPEENTCRELIKREYYFQDTDDGGQRNFIDAFINLSSKTIDEKFKKPNDITESDSQIKERELQHKLTKLYFKDLFKDHRLNLDGMLYLSNWCEREIYIAKSMTHTFRADMVIENSNVLFDCVEFTVRLMRNGQDAFNTPRIFQWLYEDWTRYNVTDIQKLGYGTRYFNKKQAQGEEYESIKNKVMYNARTYSLGYFNYFQTFLENLEPDDGNFRSIKEYCREIGHTLVSESGFILD